MIIVEHNPALRRLMERNMGQLHSTGPVFITGDADAALAHLKKEPVEVLLVDTETRSAADFELLDIAHRLAPTTKIILLSTEGEKPLKAKIRRLELPVNGYVDKSTFLTELFELDSR